MLLTTKDHRLVEVAEVAVIEEQEVEEVAEVVVKDGMTDHKPDTDPQELMPMETQLEEAEAAEVLIEEVTEVEETTSPEMVREETEKTTPEEETEVTRKVEKDVPTGEVMVKKHTKRNQLKMVKPPLMLQLRKLRSLLRKSQRRNTSKKLLVCHLKITSKL